MVWKKRPEIGTLQEFETIKKHNKKNYPIKYFFRECIPSWFSYKVFYIKQKVWEFKHKYIPRYNYSKCPTGLDPRYYYDIPSLMVHVNFKFLERFVEKEKCFDIINWDSDSYHQCVASEIEDLYWWWKNERVKREKIEDSLYSQINTDTIYEINSETEKIYRELSRLENLWQQEDTYNLKRLMQIRPYLWT